MFEKLNSLFKGKKKNGTSRENGELKDNKVKKKEEQIFKIDFEGKKAELPEIEDKSKVDLRYGLIIPYAYAHVYWDDVQGEIVYSVEEPSLDVKEKEILNTLEQGIQELIDISFVNVDDKEVLVEYLEKNVKVLLKELGIEINRNSYLKLMYYIYRDFIGLNRLEPLMNDQLIEDVGCNGAKTPIYIVHRKFGNIRTNVVYDDFDELTNFVEKLAQKCGKYISYANPIMDGKLPDGSRVNATYTEDVTSKGPTFSIRMFTKEAWSPIKLMQVGTVSAEILAYLWILVEYGSNILIVGGTGSGKCVTGDTLIHLANGEVKPIRDIVEGKFAGNKIVEKEGWEYVEGTSTDSEVLSMDVDDLRIKGFPIQRFWRHKAPRLLYRIRTRSGRNITTTGEHPFFGLDNGSLTKIRADKLSIKDRVAVPRNVPIDSNKPKFSIINSLLNEKDIYVYDCYDLVKNLSDKLGKRLGMDNSKLARKFGINDWTFKSWCKNNAIPLNILGKLALENNVVLKEDLIIKSKTSSKSIKIPEINKDLFRFVSLVLSDGHLTKRYVEFHNKDKNLLENFIDLGFNLFGINGKIEYPKDRVTKVRLNSIPISRIMNKVFDIPYGKKAGKITVPRQLFVSDKACIASFISGVIDCEAHISNVDIDIGMKSSIFLRQLNSLLLRLGVVSRFGGGEERPRIEVSGLNNIVRLNSFLELGNENKLRSLNQLMHRKMSRANSNVDLIPNISRLVNEIRKSEGLTQKEFAYKVGVSRRLIGRWEDESRLPSVYTFRDVADNFDFPLLKTIAYSDLFWDEVLSIDVLENHGEKYVYDLTVDEHHNFLAGDIPLIVHNTSLLNSIAFFIQPEHRIVTIEDTRELRLMHENWLPSAARAGTGVGEDGTGEVTLFDLLRASFRQRPDYLIVGEIRGKEAFVMFQSMSSGHPGISTMHADDVKTVIRRLQTEPINLSPSLIETLDIVCLIGHAKVKGEDTRKLKAIQEIISVGDKGDAEVNLPFQWDANRNVFMFKRESEVFKKIVSKKGVVMEELQKEFEIRRRLLMTMYQRKIIEFEDAQKVINSYYKNKNAVMKRFGLI